MSRRVHPARLLLCVLASCALAACGRESSSTQPKVPAKPPLIESSAEEEASLFDRPTRYPEGQWRSASPEDLGKTVVWLSHILIRHREVMEQEVSFTVTGWQTAQPPVKRTRREALLLASRLARSARENGNFAELAREYSEEPESRVRGGSLGGMIARHLGAWPYVLDAVATLKPGEVSEVVASEYGYHVFQRNAPVRADVVSGAHIVIAHDGAGWIGTAQRRPVPRRTRSEAIALARTLFERASKDPASFPELVAEYSEHRDAVRGGDFGSWSTREPTGYPREVETLAALEVGQVAEPIDTMFGIQIIQRTPNRSRERFAMTQIVLPFLAASPDTSADSRLAVVARARALSQELQAHPDRFAARQQSLCCVDVFEVIEGRDIPALEAALGKLTPGQIASEPLEDRLLERVSITKRLPTESLPAPPSPRTSLPGEPEL